MCNARHIVYRAWENPELVYRPENQNRFQSSCCTVCQSLPILVVDRIETADSIPARGMGWGQLQSPWFLHLRRRCHDSDYNIKKFKICCPRLVRNNIHHLAKHGCTHTHTVPRQLLKASVYMRCVCCVKQICQHAPKTLQGSSGPWSVHQAWPHAPTASASSEIDLKGVTKFFIVSQRVVDDQRCAVLWDLTWAFKCPCTRSFVTDCVYILQKITPGSVGLCLKAGIYDFRSPKKCSVQH